MREENLYRRAGVWWLRATVKGVEHRESLRTADVKVARKRRDERIEAIKGARFHGEQRISWKDAVVAWGDHELGQISPNTAKRYLVSLKQCEPYLSQLTIDVVDGKAINNLVAARRKAGATPTTIRRDLTAVSRVLTFAEAHEWREGNPTLSKRKLLRERRDPIVLPEPVDIEFVISACSPRFGALVRAAWLTGCRQDELVTAMWRGLNANALTLEVIGKGRKRRTISLSEEGAAHFSAQPRTLRSDLIFCRDTGEPFTQAASDFTHFRRTAASRAKKAGQQFRPFRFHDLRHLYAVEQLRTGRGLYDLSKHLGHTSVKTTEIYLAFLTPEQAGAAKSTSAQIAAQPQRFVRG